MLPLAFFLLCLDQLVTDMNDIDILRLATGLLQFGVAWYALRLGRLFRSTLTGWLLFGALSLLALLSLFLAVEPLDAGAQWGIKVDIIYSVLLLAGGVSLSSSLKNFLREEEAKRQALDKWESQVKEQWVELIKANEKLRQTISQLETEVAERKKAQEEGGKNLQDLQEQLAAARQREAISPPVATGPQTEAVEQRPAPLPEPVPEPAEANGEHPLTAPDKNGHELLPAVAEADTAIILQEPVAEPAPKPTTVLAPEPAMVPAPEPAPIPASEPAAVPASEPAPMLASESVEKNGEYPPGAPYKNGHESLPVVVGFDAEIISQKPVPELVEKNGEHPLTARRKNGNVSRHTPLLSGRKVAARKSSRSGQKRRVQTR